MAVAKRIAGLQKTLGTVTAREHQIDSDAILRSLSRIAQTTRNDSAKVRPLELIARLLGLFVDPSRVKFPWDGKRSSFTKPQWVALLTCFVDTHPEFFTEEDMKGIDRQRYLYSLPDKQYLAELAAEYGIENTPEAFEEMGTKLEREREEAERRKRSES